MAIVVASGNSISTAANTKGADQVTGSYQFVGKGKITVAARGSATGMLITVLVGGVALVQDQPITYFGGAGGLSLNDHVMCSQVMPGGRVEVFLRNGSAGALSTDFLVLFDRM